MAFLWKNVNPSKKVLYTIIGVIVLLAIVGGVFVLIFTHGGSRCNPKCSGKSCGDDDGCGGRCDGPCPVKNYVCENKRCICPC